MILLSICIKCTQCLHVNIFQGATPQEKDMQDWMKSLLQKMNSNKTERNIKIFIAKLIVNVEEVS